MSVLPLDKLQIKKIRFGIDIYKENKDHRIAIFVIRYRLSKLYLNTGFIRHGAGMWIVEKIFEGVSILSLRRDTKGQSKNKRTSLRSLE